MPETTIIPPPFIGVDLARPGGDQTAELILERLPDGTLRMIECRTYGPTIEGNGEAIDGGRS